MQNCYSSKSNVRAAGATSIEKEVMEEQNERLTKAHIETLGFVQDLARDNKTLQQRVTELEKLQSDCSEIHRRAETAAETMRNAEEEYHKKVQQLETELNKKHMEQLKEQHDRLQLAQEAWGSERKTLQTAATQYKLELEKEQQKVRELEDRLSQNNDNGKSRDQVMRQLREQLEKLKQENNNLRQESTHLKEWKVKHDALNQELKSSEQQRKELELKMKQLERDQGSNEEADKGLRDIIAKQKNKIHNLTEECGKTKNENAQLLDENKKLYAEVRRLAEENESLKNETSLLRDDTVRLRMTMANVSNARSQENVGPGVNFREFVSLKRELLQLREENELLREKLRILSGTVLPPIAPRSDSAGRHKGQIGVIQQQQGSHKTTAYAENKRKK